MCGRYFIYKEPEDQDLTDYLRKLNRYAGQTVKTEGEIFPADTAPVLAVNRRREKRVFPMEWGFTLPGGRRVINARGESAGERPLFRDSFAARRCAVLASGYYEWDHNTPAHAKYAIRARDRRPIYMAGLYRMEQDKPVFSILTRPVAPAISFIHHRMPVILSRDAALLWIDPDQNPAPIMARAIDDVAAEKMFSGPEQTMIDWEGEM